MEGCLFQVKGRHLFILIIPVGEFTLESFGRMMEQSDPQLPGKAACIPCPWLFNHLFTERVDILVHQQFSWEKHLSFLTPCPLNYEVHSESGLQVEKT